MQRCHRWLAERASAADRAALLADLDVRGILPESAVDEAMRAQLQDLPVALVMAALSAGAGVSGRVNECRGHFRALMVLYSMGGARVRNDSGLR